NARDAMPRGGNLILSATTDEVEAGRASEEPPAGSYIRFVVEDTGSGMSAATLARAMEPFFTTKPIGKGTGLGLAMARGFAEQSGGRLRIESTPGQGTTVKLWFPLASTDEASASEATNAHRSTNGKSARLIVVDDEPLIREIITEQLEATGYSVL